MGIGFINVFRYCIKEIEHGLMFTRSSFNRYDICLI